MPFSFNLLATDCPAIQVPASVVSPVNNQPPVSKGLVIGNTLRADVVPFWNQNFRLADFAGRSAGGAFGVVLGLDFSSGGGLSLLIAAGWAFVDGMVYRSAVTHALTDGQRNFIWINQAGGVSHAVNTTPPSGAQAFLGSVLTSGGAIIQIDGSGVVFVNGMAYRRTNDAGEPGDTPPASLRLLTETVGGVYLWTGTRYWQMG